MRGLWLLKHANLAAKGLWLRRKPSKHLQLSSSSAALAVGRPPAFRVPPQHSNTSNSWKQKYYCHVLSVQEKCSMKAPCLSSPGFHHLLKQRAYEEGESLLPQSLYFSNSHWKLLVTPSCGWWSINQVTPSCDVDGSRRVPHQTEDQHRLRATCTTATDILILTSTSVHLSHKTKHKSRGAHRGARGTFAGKLAIGLKHLYAAVCTIWCHFFHNLTHLTIMQTEPIQPFWMKGGMNTEPAPWCQHLGTASHRYYLIEIHRATRTAEESSWWHDSLRLANLSRNHDVFESWTFPLFRYHECQA